MPFTKAQRLKGLKKQLKNLGYDVVNRGASVEAGPDNEVDIEDDMSERGSHTLQAMVAREEAW